MLIINTMNYQSTPFNIIHHGHNNQDSSSFTKLYKQNPKVCRRIKGTAEYSDLTRVTASKLNHYYEKAIKQYPKPFIKCHGMLTQYCDSKTIFDKYYQS